MKRNYYYVALVFLTIVLGYFMWNYSTVRRQIDLELESSRQFSGERAGGGWEPLEFRIVDSQPNPQLNTINSSNKIQQDSLGWFRVVDLNFENINDVDLEVLRVNANFHSEGESYEAEIPIFDGVLYIDPDVGPRVADVREIDIRLGDEVVIYVSYLPDDNPLTQEELQLYCEFFENSGCLYAIKQGYGKSVINFREYFSGDVEDGVFDLDISKVFVTMVKVVRSEE